jgi:hypothetical protein
MMIEQLELVTVIIITVVTGVIAAMIATVLSLFIQYELRQREETNKLEKVYLTPLLISAWELCNKLNDIVKNRARVLSYSKGLSNTMNNVNSVDDVLSNHTMIYLSSVLYLFARYFANVEAIKKDVGLLQLMKEKETRALQLRLRQTVAVFFSGRLHEGFTIIQDNRLKYQGTILEGEQVLVGEMMLKQEEGLHRCISFYEFCHKITTDTDFRQCISPIVSFLGDLEENYRVSPKYPSDFRWAKLIVFALFLRKLVEKIDKSKALVFLPELEKYEQEYLEQNEKIRENIKRFKKAHPVHNKRWRMVPGIC